MRSLSRQLRGRRIVRALAFIFLVWSVVEVHYISRSLQQGVLMTTGPPLPDSPSELESKEDHERNVRAVRERRWEDSISSLQQSLSLKRRPRIYIASLHWNNEKILRSHWNAALLDLVRALGPENVFVAVHEGGSWDGSAAALRELDAQLSSLGVARDIVLDSRTHKQEVENVPPGGTPGWIETPRGRRELRRIPYLARLRNKSIARLREMAEANDWGKGRNETLAFDRVLFLNDVVFSVDDVLALLLTKEGHYAAACSIDFAKPPEYYDTFALRDIEGHEHATHTWPFFRSSKSRQALKMSIPVPVKSCWNGIVAMPASVFTVRESPLLFRGIPDSLALRHLEGSECCLIHADNPLSATRGVWLNPNVRVGYSGDAYDAVHPSDGHAWLSWWDIWAGLWRNRLRRMTATPAVKEWKVRRLVQQWRSSGDDGMRNDVAGDGEDETGLFCLINEMQVLAENGWAHV
ncbi:hypothetical protein ACKVV1_010839 [Pyricularia oryzae]